MGLGSQNEESLRKTTSVNSCKSLYNSHNTRLTHMSTYTYKYHKHKGGEHVFMNVEFRTEPEAH